MYVLKYWCTRFKGPSPIPSLQGRGTKKLASRVCCRPRHSFGPSIWYVIPTDHLGRAVWLLLNFFAKWLRTGQSSQQLINKRSKVAGFDPERAVYVGAVAGVVGCGVARDKRLNVAAVHHAVVI